MKIINYSIEIQYLHRPKEMFHVTLAYLRLAGHFHNVEMLMDLLLVHALQTISVLLPTADLNAFLVLNVQVIKHVSMKNVEIHAQDLADSTLNVKL